jgi:outer membrane protein assembly factor BamD (BamD/ComL family)
MLNGIAHFYFISMKKIFLCLFIFSILMGCSQNSSSPMSVAYHNTNAKFNALFQSKLKMEEVERKLFESHKDNYSQLLDILIPVDSNSAGAVSEQLAAVIKKSSLIVERHQNSKWLDDAYILIAKARLLKGDFRNAMETFKFVNGTATSEDQRGEALIGLMRAYIEQKEFATALRVADILREEDLNKNNTRDFYLTKAYLHQQEGDYKLSVGILEEAFPYMDKNEQKARVQYAAGQMYEGLGDMENASFHYAEVKKNRPNYDLDFYAKLNNALVSNKTTEFENLLKDTKNKDLQDRIYEAMAQVESRKKNDKGAAEFYQKSLRSASQNRSQLPYTYMKLADLNYNKLQNYELASAYYDSCAALLPPQDPQFKRVTERFNSLSQYVKQVTIIRTEDSLQKLANMNPAALDKLLEKVVRQKADQEAAELARAQEIINQKNNPNPVAPTANEVFADPNKKDWYFTNQTSLTQGKLKFSQLWGASRQLEDNWRRGSKDNATTTFGAFNDKATNGTENNRSASVGGVSNDELKRKKQDLYDKIPFSKEGLVKSKKLQENAYFELGKIYKLNLNEPTNAITTFEKLLATFPATTHEPEALYLLYLLHENNAGKQKIYSDKLTKNYSDSYFVRLITRGDQSLASGKESEVQKIYSEAYDYFAKGNFEDASTFVETGLKDYPNSQIEDKLIFLKALLTGKTKQATDYNNALKAFINQYPKSQLIPMAKEYLAATQGR